MRSRVEAWSPGLPFLSPSHSPKGLRAIARTNFYMSNMCHVMLRTTVAQRGSAEFKLGLFRETDESQKLNFLSFGAYYI